jgi:hypothetical protein
MVQIIEDQQNAVGGECIRFRPYESKRYPGVIAANWQHTPEPASAKGPAPVPQDTPGTRVDIEFMRAVEVAYQDGVPFVWIDDPNGLFPPADRPTF